MEKLLKTKPKKKINVSIKSINTVAQVIQNQVTGAQQPSVQIFGLGDDDRIYYYESNTKEWFEL